MALVKDNFPAVVRTLRNEESRMAEAEAEFIRDRAKNFAPVATGNLRSRIRVEGEGKSRTVISDTKDRGDPPLIWSTQRDYAYYEEYGSVYNAAHPYMTPAAMEGKTHMNVVGRQMGDRVEASAESGRTI